MKLVMGELNGVTLDGLHRRCLEEGCTGIRAAVAYAFGKPPLFVAEHCPVPVEFFGRSDGVAPDLLDAMLAQPGRVTCHLVPERRRLHAKIIWWQGSGAYVGSANLTDQGWSENLESGVFYDRAELAEGVGVELLRFFDHLKGGALVSPTPKLIAELRALHAARASAAEQASRTLAGIESAAAVLPEATAVVDVDLDGETLHVPPVRQDYPIAYKLRRKTSEQGKRMWHAPALAWAYYVIGMREPETRHVDLALNGGRSAQGTVSEYIRIMYALVPKGIQTDRDIIVDWLRTAEKCRNRPPGSTVCWPVSKQQMLEVISLKTPQERQRAYRRFARNNQRRRSAVGRPAA